MMMNTFSNALQDNMNYKMTENGAVAHKTTRSKVYDMFALGAAYRQRSENDVLLLFREALAEDKDLALKCLFYIRDCVKGQGERRFFRICFKWFCEKYPNNAKQLFSIFATDMCRWDDLILTALDTKAEDEALGFIAKQLVLDSYSDNPSLLAKWCPSENTSSAKTRAAARKVRHALQLSSKEYRLLLSNLRKRINVLERLMSANEWDKIEFDKIPSKAGLVYKQAFMRRDLIAKKYSDFIKNENTKVNVKTLYPYEIVKKAMSARTDVDKAAVEKYWNNQPDWFKGAAANIICVVDTSGSMTWGSGNVNPIDVACSLGMYAAERLNGPFHNRYISFSSRPQLIEIRGVDFCDKVRRIYRANLCDNTDLTAVFDLLKRTALQPNVNKEDIPTTIVVISDMEIDEASGYYHSNRNLWSKASAGTTMERVRKEWAEVGLKMPKLVYWNVNARNDTILDLGPNVSYVSGCSPVIFKQIMTDVTGYKLMLDKLMSDRYKNIHF